MREVVLLAFILVLCADLRAHGDAVVTLSTDDGIGTTSGTLSFAILQGGNVTFANGITTIALSGNLPLITQNTTINAGGSQVTIDGGGSSRAFMVTGGTVSLNSLQIQNTKAQGGAGGTGDNGGGGALGAGGGLFVGATAAVTLNSVNFQSTSATGGAGGGANIPIDTGGGGGGLNGGNGGTTTGIAGGGGGGSITGNGGSPSGFTGGAGGPNGGGTGGNFAGNGGSGGFGGGGGGGGAGNGNGGNGGFGGGGGGAGTGSSTGVAGSGGFGAGNGAGNIIGLPGSGGSGYGGAVFVQTGGSLTVNGTGTLSGTHVTAASGGQAAGQDFFLMSGTSTTLAPGTNHTLTSNGTIADDGNPGSALVIGSAGTTGGTVILNNTNTYTGGTIVDHGATLQLGNGGSTKGTFGSGSVTDNSALVFNEGVATTISNSISGTGSLTQEGVGTLTISGPNSYQGGTTLQTGTLVLGSNSALGTGALTTIDPTVVYMNGIAISNPIVMMGDTTLEVDNADSATQSGAISESGGSFAVTKTGTGTLIVSGPNSYTGGTTISAGTLNAGSNNAFETNAVTVDAGGSLQLSGGITLANNITISGTGAGGAGAIFSTAGVSGVVNGNVTLAGDATVNNASTFILFLGGAVNLAAHDLTLGGGGDSQITGQISGTGGLTIAGNSIAFLTGSTANTYNGLTTVTAGSLLNIGKNSGLTAMAGNLDISGTVEDYATGQLAATTVVTLSGTGQFNFRNQGTTETIAGLNGTSGTIIVPFINGGGNTLTFDGSGAYNYAGQINDKAGGSGSLTITLVMNGTGSQILTGANNYSGGTTISAGVLQLGDGSTTGAALGSGDVTVNGTGTFTLDLANNETFSNHIIDNHAVILDDSINSNYTVAGLISGSGTLTKTGSNTVTLTHANTYSGGTTISGGTLFVGDTDALGTGSVVNNATLTTTSVNHGLAIDIGGDFTQGPSGVVGLAIYGPGDNDSINLTNPSSVIHLDGELVLVLPNNYAPGAGETHDIFTSSNPVQGQFSQVVTSDPSIGIKLNYTDNVTVLFQLPFAGLGTGNYTPNELAVAQYLDANDQLISNPSFGQLIGALNSLSGAPGGLGPYLNQLTSLNFARFASSSNFNGASFQIQQFDNYLANHRGADGAFVASNGGIDYSGLTFNDPNVDSSLQVVHGRLLAWNPAPNAGLLSDVATPVLGGVDMKEMKSCSACAPQNLWNVFVSGSVVLAQDFSDPSAGLNHTDTTTGAGQIGFDYRLDPHCLIGALFGYGHTDATLDTLDSKATVDTYSPGVYASYADGGWYANTLGSYGFANYTQDRNVSIGAFSGTAHSSPSGDQIVGNLGGGYDFHRGPWTFGPTAGIQYVHLDVDGYTETGLPGADLTVNRDQSDSLRSHLGGRIAYAIEDGGLVFTPHLSASWQHEFMDQGRGITVSFNDVAGGSFAVRTANPSRDSVLADLGLDAQIDKTWTVFADYTVQAGQDNYFGQSIQAGMKVGF